MLTGRCLCGAVRYRTEAAPKFVFNCYCATCRRESGAGHLTLVGLPAEGFVVEGELKTVLVPRAKERPPIPRFFCPNCGSTLFVRPLDDDSIINLRAGTLDGVHDLKVQINTFGSHAQSWDPPLAGVESNDWGEGPETSA